MKSKENSADTDWALSQWVRGELFPPSWTCAAIRRNNNKSKAK